MRKIEQMEKQLSSLQKELRDSIVVLMRDYGEEKLLLYPNNLKEPAIIRYYDDYNEEYCKGTVSAVIYRDETLLLEVENEMCGTLQLNEKLGDLVFDVPQWMIAIYRNMCEQIESEKSH